MTDVIARAKIRLAEIAVDRVGLEMELAALDNEAAEIETAIAVLNRLCADKSTPKYNQEYNSPEKAVEEITPDVSVSGASEPETPSEEITSDAPDAPAIAEPDAPQRQDSAPDTPVDEDLAPRVDGDAGEAATPAVSPAPRRAHMQTRVRQIHAAHPNWTSHQIAAALDSVPEYVVKTAKRLGINLVRDKRGPKPGRARNRHMAPTSEPVQPQEPVAAPAYQPSLPRPVGAEAEPARPIRIANLGRGAKIMLRDRETGLYLHHSVSRDGDGKPALTDRRTYPWQGTESNLVAVRRALPETMEFDVVAVVKETEARAGG